MSSWRDAPIVKRNAWEDAPLVQPAKAPSLGAMGAEMYGPEQPELTPAEQRRQSRTGSVGPRVRFSPPTQETLSPDQAAIDPLLRQSLLGGTAVSRGLTSVATAPVDIPLSLGILGANMYDDERSWDEDLFPVTEFAFDKGTELREALGLPYTEPQTYNEKLASNVLEFGAGGLGAPVLARKVVKNAPELSRLIPFGAEDARMQRVADARADRIMASMPDQPSKGTQIFTMGKAELERAKPTLGSGASGAGAGTGYTVAEDQFPDEPLIQFGGAMAGGAAGPSIARTPKAAAEVPQMLKDRTRADQRYVDAVDPSLPMPTRKDQDMVERMVQQYAGGPEEAIRAAEGIDATMLNERPGSVMPTTATASDNTSLIGLEQAMRIDPESAPAFDTRSRAREQQNTEDLQRFAPSETGNKAAVGEEISRQVKSVEDQAALDVAEARQLAGQGKTEIAEKQGQIALQNQREANAAAEAADTAEKTAQQRQAELAATGKEAASTPRMSEAESGRTLVKEVLEPEYEKRAAEYRSKIEPFEKDTTKSIDTAAVRKDLDSIDVGSAGDNYIRVFNDVKGKLEAEKLSPSELLGIEQKLNKEIANAKGVDGAAREALGELRTRVETLLDNHMPAEAAEQWKDARRYYREEVAEPFRQGEGRKTLASGANREEFKRAPEQAPAAYFKPDNKGGGATMQQLKKSGDYGQIKDTMRGFVFDDIVKNKKYIDAETGEMNVKRMREYMRDYSEAFGEIPEVRQELVSLINRYENGQSLYDQATSTFEQTKRGMRQVEERGSERAAAAKTKQKSINEMLKLHMEDVQSKATEKVRAERQSAAKYFLDDPNPDKALKSALNDKNPERTLKELWQRTKKDKTGKAQEGFKEILFDNIIQKLTRAKEGEDVVKGGSTGVRSIEAYDELLKDTGIYSEKDLETLRMVRNRIATDERVGRKAIANSQTAPNAEKVNQLQQAVRAGFQLKFGMLKGGGLSRIFNDVTKQLGIGKAKDELRTAMLREVMLNPELGRLALKRDLTRYERSLLRAKIKSLSGELRTGQQAQRIYQEEIDKEEPDEQQ